MFFTKRASKLTVAERIALDTTVSKMVLNELRKDDLASQYSTLQSTAHSASETARGTSKFSTSDNTLNANTRQAWRTLKADS